MREGTERVCVGVLECFVRPAVYDLRASITNDLRPKAAAFENLHFWRFYACGLVGLWIYRVQGGGVVICPQVCPTKIVYISSAVGSADGKRLKASHHSSSWLLCRNTISTCSMCQKNTVHAKKKKKTMGAPRTRQKRQFPAE